MSRVDYTATASAYRKARTLPPNVLDAWTAAIRAIGIGRLARVVDVGAGPGGFLPPLLDWFGAPVVAVEPSVGMRAEAAGAGLTDRFPYVAAPAEALPLAAGSVDLAWLSTVIHQFDDLDAAIDELWRIVRPAGWVLVRGFFAELPPVGLLGRFPGIERSARTFPATDVTVARFERAGFALDRVVDVTEPWRFELASWLERVRSIRHTDSALRPLTDDEFEHGVRNVQEAYADADGPIRSDGILRLLVLRR